jgi:single-strand DNA-binding protein
MYSLNRAQLIGNITVDPEVRALPNGQRVANFSLATNRRYTDSAGVQQDVPEYHNVVMFGKLAEIAEQYIHKGNKLYVEGRIQTRSWEDQSGQKKYKTEIVAEEMIMLTPKGTPAEGNSYHSASPAPQNEDNAPVHTTIPPKEERVSIEDVPF